MKALLITLIMTGILAQFMGSSTPNESESRKLEGVYPGSEWEERKLAEVGLSQAKLDKFRDFIGGRGCVVRHGYMVYKWGDQSKRADIASAAKPIYSYFIFKALEEGKISSLDDKVSVFEPRLNEINAELGFKDRNITWRYLANQTACYGVVESPGTAFDYNDWQMALLWDTLFLKVYGATYENVDDLVLRPRLSDPINCQDDPTFMAFGTDNRPGRVAISVRDFARFGLLHLQNGKWNDKQIIKKEHVIMSVSDPVPNSIPRTAGKEAEMIAGQRSIGSTLIPDNQGEHFGSYSWLWWINGTDSDRKRMWSDATVDTYGAFGHGGIRGMFVVPTADIVVSYNDAQDINKWVNGSESPLNQAIKLLIESIVDSE